MKAIDLFCGIGGFHYACKENNIDVVFASEIDKYATQQYFLNHQLQPHGDITKIKAEDIPQHDILLGGFPCQPFSLAGTKKGLEDTRGTLFYEIARILEYHKPRFFVLENVPNLLSHDKGKTINVINSVFEQLGYFLKIKILNAAHFVLAQVRQRAFIVGFKNKDEYFSFQFPTGTLEKVVLKDILELEVDEKYFIKNEKMFSHIERKSSSKNHKECYVYPEQSFTLTARQYSSWNGNYVTEPILGRGTQKQGQRVFDTDNLYCSLTRNPEFITERVAQNEKGNQGYRVYNSEENAIALCSKGGGFSQTGLYEVNKRIRKLTPRECARLQGFPEGYKIECSDHQAYKQFGNSVPVPVVSAILKNILRCVC